MCELGGWRVKVDCVERRCMRVGFIKCRGWWSREVDLKLVLRPEGDEIGYFRPGRNVS